VVSPRLRLQEATVLFPDIEPEINYRRIVFFWSLLPVLIRRVTPWWLASY